MGEFELEAGPLFLGFTLNILLYGITVMQTLEYYRNSRSDPKWIKCFVAFLFLADTFNSGIDIAVGYVFFVSSFGDFAGLSTLTWYGNSVPATTSIIAASCQLFYAYRVRRLSKKEWLFWLIMATAIIEGLGGIATSIGLAMLGRLDLLYKLKGPIVVWIGCSIITDILIAVALVWHLRRSKTGFTSTDDTISKIIQLTIQTGVLTTIWTITDLTVYFAIKGDVHLFFTYPLCKIYSNSVLSSLNARYRWVNTTCDDGSNMYDTGASTPKFRMMMSRSSTPIPPDLRPRSVCTMSGLTPTHCGSLEFAPTSQTQNRAISLMTGSHLSIRDESLQSTARPSLERDEREKEASDEGKVTRQPSLRTSTEV